MKGLLVLLLMLSAAAAYGEIYTWRDGGGTEHYTNSLDEIPARYLKKARVLDVATGKKGGLATAHPPSQSAPAATPGQTPVPPPLSPQPEAITAPAVTGPMPPHVPAAMPQTAPPAVANPGQPPAGAVQPQSTRVRRPAHRQRTRGADED